MTHYVKNPVNHRINGVLNGEPGDYLLSRKIRFTIIGVEAFHCPVRDGKEWFHPAMASGLKTVACSSFALQANSDITNSIAV